VVVVVVISEGCNLFEAIDVTFLKILRVSRVQIHTFLLASLWTFWNPYSVSDNIQKVIKLNTLDLAQQKVWPVLGT